MGSRNNNLLDSLGFVYRSAAVDGFGKPGKSAAAAAVTLTTQGEMCTTKTKKPLGTILDFSPLMN